MEELKFVSLKTQNQKVRAPRITWRRIKSGIIQSLAISFAAIVAATLLMSLCILLSTCAEGKPDPAEFVGPVGPSKPKPVLDAGQGGSSAGGSNNAGGMPGSAGSYSSPGAGGSSESSPGGSFGSASSGGSYGTGGSSPNACDLVGKETCTGLDEDCDGLVDCQDPDCASQPTCAPYDAGNCSGELAIHLLYQGPVWPGTNSLYAWWMPPGQVPHAWSVIDECADMSASDGKLDCIFHVPHCATGFEFQVFLPYSRFWGDMSCSVNGGCGDTIGSVALDVQGTQLLYSFKSNGDKDPNCSGGCDPYPYKNGLVDFVP